MHTFMSLDNPTAIDRLVDFLSGTQTVAFSVLSKPVAHYEWVQKTPGPLPVAHPIGTRLSACT